MTALIHATIYTGSHWIENGYIRFDEQIKEIGEMVLFDRQEEEAIIDAVGNIIIPGFIDSHSHGGYGYDSMDATPEEIDQMVTAMKKEGITSYFCTTMTQSVDKIEKSLQNIAKAAERNPTIQGIHLEGPFISPVYKGAQDPQYIKNPDAELMARWQKLSGNRIKLVTYAPEQPGAAAFEKYCEENGIVLSAGHTNATYAELLQSKATHITHLYNAQRGLHHREPGVTGYGLLTKKVTCEVIVDGLHIHPDMIRLAYLAKGAEGIVVITDAMRAKGMPEGKSELGGQDVFVKDKAARLADGTLAGSILEYQTAFANILAFTGCTLEEAVRMTSGNQAHEFGLTHKGELAVGKDADFNVLDEKYNLLSTYSLGQK